MTAKEREDRFIEHCRETFGTLTFESELLLRHGYAAGASELGSVAFADGVAVQRARVLDALGASAKKESYPP